MTRKILGALAAVSLLASAAQAQVQVIGYAAATSPYPVPEPSEEEVGEKICHELFDSVLPWRSSKFQECLRNVHEEAARNARASLLKEPTATDRFQLCLKQLEKCKALRDDGDYANYEACYRVENESGACKFDYPGQR